MVNTISDIKIPDQQS